MFSTQNETYQRILSSSFDIIADARELNFFMVSHIVLLRELIEKTNPFCACEENIISNIYICSALTRYIYINNKNKNKIKNKFKKFTQFAISVCSNYNLVVEDSNAFCYLLNVKFQD